MRKLTVWRRVGLWAAALPLAMGFLASGALLHAATPGTVAPVVPGHDRLVDAKADAATRGQLLLGELNCISCHKPEANARVQVRQAPDLTHAGARITPQYLQAYLTNPQALKPGTSMPNIFHASAPAAKEGAVEALTHYLVSLGGPIKPASVEGNRPMVAAGDRLFHSIGCVACHAPRKNGKPVDTKSPAVPLGDLASKTTVDQLALFLLDPHQARPSGRMPSLSLTSEESRSIAVFLLQDQLSNPQNKEGPPVAVSGIKYSYFELMPKDAAIETFDKIKNKPKAEGSLAHFTANVPGNRGQNWAVRFTGALIVPRTGAYAFHVTSDDGARLYIGGKQIVNNDGIHAPQETTGKVQLTAGQHPIVVTYFNAGSGAELKVQWSGPGIEKSEIPSSALTSNDGRPMVPLNSAAFTVDPAKAALGSQMFSVLGCAACHEIPGQKSLRPYKALSAVNVDSAEGCLGEQVKKGAPQYSLSADQRDALKAAIKDQASLAKPLDAKAQVRQSMAALNCYACHKRDDIGGPGEDRQGFFAMTAEFDMGDEGRLPPTLSGVGEKLKPGAIEQIVCEGKLHIRPVLATRMPVFQKPSTEKLLAALPLADAIPNAPVSAAFSADVAKEGRVLFGNKGLGCVNCHGVLGTKSLGMPAPDLTTAYERLTFAWYSRLMIDPNSVNPATRMPGFWPGGVVAIKELGGGTTSGQIGALHTYLSLGTSMGLPAGLQPSGKSELAPSEEPILHRTFMADVGPRAVLVGYPEQLNIAFDANLVRLATVWRGRFFDTRGMWESRGGQALAPLGIDVLKLPALPTFAVLSDPAAAWPTPIPNPDDGNIARNIGGKFLGYQLDKEKRPIFKYQLGDVLVHEQPIPRLNVGGATLIRKFEVSGKGENLYLLAAVGKTIEKRSADTFLVDGKITVHLKLAADAIIRDAEGGKQLILPIPLKGDAHFELEMSW